jgi:hypothetical protein
VQLVTVPSEPAQSPRSRRAEATEIHTRILRLALGVEESRAYWEHVDPAPSVGSRALEAFEARWFGNRSMERVRSVLATLADRFDAPPDALHTLARWRSMDAPTRNLLCHFHLQLSDPMYRRFTGSFLVQRRGLREPKVDRDAALRWVKSEFPDRWSEVTCIQFATKLLAAASEAGLVSAKRDPRQLLFPKVSDLALTYLLYLLRSVAFEGSLTENAYLQSVGLTGGLLDQRLRALTAVAYHRMAHLTEFEWEYPSLIAWAEATL